MTGARTKPYDALWWPSVDEREPRDTETPTVFRVSCSLGDLFHPSVAFEFIDRVFAVMALCPQHTFQVLTKRPERMAEYLNRRERLPGHHGPHDWRPPCDRIYSAMAAIKGVDNCTAARGGMVLTWPLPNVWLGTSCEDQPAADERVRYLLRCPAAVRFLSCEPLVGSVDLDDVMQSHECPRCGYINTLSDVQVAGYTNAEWGGCLQCGAVLGTGEVCGGLPVTRERPGVDWVIVGGESGHNARPCDVRWIRSIVEQCNDDGVAVFVKQLGTKPVHSWFTDDVLDDPNSDAVLVDGGYPSRAVIASSRKDNVPLCLQGPRGADPDEWPDDLRVREMPKAAVDGAGVAS